MSRLYLPLAWVNRQGPGTGRAGHWRKDNHENWSLTVCGISCVAQYPFGNAASIVCIRTGWQQKKKRGSGATSQLKSLISHMFASARVAMTMPMTHSQKSIQHPSVAWPSKHEWKGHDPKKKSLWKLMGLAQLAKCVLAHCWWQCVVTSNTKKKEGMSQTQAVAGLNSLNSRIAGILRFRATQWRVIQEDNRKKSVAGTGAHQSDLCRRFRLSWIGIGDAKFSDSVLIPTGLYPVVSASPK